MVCPHSVYFSSRNKLYSRVRQSSTEMLPYVGLKDGVKVLKLSVCNESNYEYLPGIKTETQSLQTQTVRSQLSVCNECYNVL